MRLKNVKDADIKVANSPYTINEPIKYVKKWNSEVFKNNNPIHIEIGSGRGQFIIKMAEKYPNINFIGIEMQDSALVKAVNKLEQIPYNLPNLRLLCFNALNLAEVFDKEIECIYLNFSDPWPKKRHAKRRLTSEIFLKIYDKLFLKDSIIIQKTDNNDLFEYSMESLKNYGYSIVYMSRDYNDENNIETEYEEKFRKEGIKINYCKYIKNNGG